MQLLITQLDSTGYNAWMGSSGGKRLEFIAAQFPFSPGIPEMTFCARFLTKMHDNLTKPT